MTAPSYAKLIEALKPRTEVKPAFEIEAHGYCYPSWDIVSASILCHRNSGTLYRLVHDGDETHRIEETPLDLAIAKDCQRRRPAKAEAIVRCVPVFGR